MLCYEHCDGLPPFGASAGDTRRACVAAWCGLEQAGNGLRRSVFLLTRDAVFLHLVVETLAADAQVLGKGAVG